MANRGAKRKEAPVEGASITPEELVAGAGVPEEPVERALTHPPAEVPVQPLSGLYFVAPGKAITSKKGILSEGCQVRPAFFGAKGDEVIASLVARGSVVQK